MSFTMGWLLNRSLNSHCGLLNLLVIQGGDQWEESSLSIINCTKFHSMALPQSTLLSSGEESRVFPFYPSFLPILLFLVGTLCLMSQSDPSLSYTPSFPGEGIQPGICSWHLGVNGRDSACPWRSPDGSCFQSWFSPDWAATVFSSFPPAEDKMNISPDVHSEAPGDK